MVGNLKVGDQIKQTDNRFRIFVDFESYINFIVERGYDAEDAIFKGYIYKINTPQFKKVNRCQYGNGCDFEQEIIEYRGNNCFVTTQGYCFAKHINFLTGQDYKEQYLDFIRSEERRSNIMTMARIQPCLRKLGIHLGYYNGERIYPRTVTNRKSALFFYNNHFCLIWKSEGVSFNQAVKGLKDNFKKVHNFISEENVNSHLKYEFISKKIESHLTKFFVYDLETRNTDRARPFCVSFYRLSKSFGRYGRDQTREESDKCKKDTIVFDGDNCISNALDFCLKLKSDEREVRNKVVEYNLQLHAYNGCGFDTWIVLKNLDCAKRIVKIIKNARHYSIESI